MDILRNNKLFLRNLAFLAVPIILQELLNASVNMTDTFMIGQLGVASITAVGLANQIFFLFVLIVFGINSGASIFMGQYWGKRDTDNIHTVMGICFLSSFFVAFCFFLATQVCPDLLMSFYSKDPAVIELGVIYLRRIGYTYLIIAFTLAFNTSLRSIGMTPVPMLTTLIALTINVVLNYVFIFVLHMGVKGSATATVIARLIEFLVLYSIVRVRKLPIYSDLKGYFKADKKFIKAFYAVTLPVIANEFLWALGTTIYNVAYKFSGTDAQGAFQIASTVQNLFMVIGMGIGSATGIMIANKLGAKDIAQAISYARKCMVVAGVFSVVMGLLLIASAPFILSFFDISDTVKHDAFYILVVVGLCMFLKTINFATIVGILRSGGDTKFCLLLDTASVWLIGVPCAFLGSYFLHLPIYYTVLLVYSEELFKFFVSIRRVLRNGWAKSVID